MEFDDPCTGTALHGIGTENGVVRITDLGNQGVFDLTWDA